MNADEVITEVAGPPESRALAEVAEPVAETDSGIPDVSVGDVPVENSSSTDAAAQPGRFSDAGIAAHEVSVGNAPAETADTVDPVSEIAPTPVDIAGTDGSVTADAADAEGADDLDSQDAVSADEPAPDEVRQQLLRQFETWLDRMAQGEPPPEGVPEELLEEALKTPEPQDALAADLYALFAGMTKLSGEIGLQGRAFRQLADTLAPATQVPGRLDRIEAAQMAVVRELARRPEPDKSDLPAVEDVLGVLFDLYDRLNRGLQNFDTSYKAVRSANGSVGFLQRLLGGKQQADPLAAPAAAMREGYRLTLSRLEAALLQWGIQRTGEVGEPFDPQRMAVIEVEPKPGVPDGSVLEVYRSGYVVNGRVLATARVKVARAAPR